MSQIKILSYNVFWRAMKTNNAHNKCLNNKCLLNVVNFIDSNSLYDFVGLQEAANWDLIQRKSKVLSKMTAFNYKPGIEEIVVFYDDKYLLDDSIVGWLEDTGRPFVILFFRQKICLICMHAGHSGDFYKFDTYLKNIITVNYADSKKIILNKLATYNIILMGDLNTELKNRDQYLIFNNRFYNVPRMLYGINKNKSCCSGTNLDAKVYLAYDHILSTYQNIKSSVYHITNASDHLPIIAIIDTNIIDTNRVSGGYMGGENIGYDFDGVLHMDVSAPNSKGERAPINLSGPYTPYNKILNQIRSELITGNKIYIITARNKTSQNTNAILNHLSQAKISGDISIYFTAGHNKSPLLAKLKINYFYDDSLLRTNEIYTSAKENKLPHLKKLFLVNPDNDTLTAYIFYNKNEVIKIINAIDKLTIASDKYHIDQMLKVSDLVIHFITKYDYKNKKINKIGKIIKSLNTYDKPTLLLVNKLQYDILFIIATDLKNWLAAES